MAKVKLNRQAFNKESFKDTVNTEFNELGVNGNGDVENNLSTVEDFFRLYQELFFEIPKEGETNSHTFLIKESTEYVGLEQSNQDIQELLDEIASLRERNLELEQEKIRIISELTQNPASSEEDLNKKISDLIPPIDPSKVVIAPNPEDSPQFLFKPTEFKPPII